jgi:hypothetical protein
MLSLTHRWRQDGRSHVFPRKNRAVFPARKSPLFFGRIALLGMPEGLDDLWEPSVFHAQKKAAKLHGLFLIKMAYFQK